MTTETAHHEAHSEKQHAALSSLFWALFLTLIKLGAGLATNSLGILSEALHSSLDLVAAGITFFAVRVAARPADETHPYGYGKIENLSALAETVLLLVTCGWIVHEAVNRLFFDAPEITPSWWGVIIILISLLVDVNRAAMLRRVAQKHKSQALEADALHFTTDIWSSGVVLVGLLCVQASEYLPADSPFRGILHMADAIAALFVSGIVVVVGFRLSRRAVTMLLDGGGKEHSEALEQALAKQLPLCRETPEIHQVVAAVGLVLLLRSADGGELFAPHLVEEHLPAGMPAFLRPGEAQQIPVQPLILHLSSPPIPARSGRLEIGTAPGTAHPGR